MASAVVMMIGGAITNAFAFTGGNYLFSKIGSHSDEERKRHDEAMEKLEKETKKWNEKRVNRLDFINEQMKKENYSLKEFDDVDQAMKQYYYVTGKQLPDLAQKPELSDFYTPSEHQKNRELIFIVLGMSATGLIAWKLNKI